MSARSSISPPRDQAERAGEEGSSARAASDQAAPEVGPQRSGAADSQGQAVATIAGDRTCVECGFNLIGQVVRKEPRYGLFLVRCPECGRAAAVEEHPRLGRAGYRLTALFAALWVGALTLGVFALGGAMGALTAGAAALAGEAFGAHVFQVFSESPEAAAIAQARGYERVVAWMFDPQWWSAQDQAALFRDWGGMREALWRASFILAPAVFGAFFVGVILACLLLHAPRRRLLLAPALPLAFAATIALIVWTIHSNEFNRGGSAYDAARLFMHWRVAGPALASLYIALAVGAALGRPIARALVKAMLPPRLRNSLGLLWSADGLDPRAAGGFTHRRRQAAPRS